VKKINSDFDINLLRVLVCPKTHTRLVFDEIKLELISKAAGLAYPIRNGIPILLENEARKLGADLQF
jgi:hypothetical protein